jgi:hypothetical protein
MHSFDSFCLLTDPGMATAATANEKRVNLMVNRDKSSHYTGFSSFFEGYDFSPGVAGFGKLKPAQPNSPSVLKGYK